MPPGSLGLANSLCSAKSSGPPRTCHCGVGRNPAQGRRSGGQAPALRLIVLAVTVSLLLFPLAACLPASAPATIKVGLVAPFSGRDAALGYNMLVSAKLAIKEWNDRGGAGGYYVELVAQDDGNDAEMGATQARKMALDPQMVGVIGHPSGASALGAAPVYRQAGLPALITGAALPEGAAGGPPVLTLGPGASELAREAVKFLVGSGVRRLAVVVAGGSGGDGEAGPSGTALAERVLDGARVAGIDVPGGIRTLLPGQEDALVQQLHDQGVDLVYYGGTYVGAAHLLTALKSARPSTAFLGGPGVAYPDLLKLAGLAAEGAYYLSPGRGPAGVETARPFVEAYRAAAGIDPWTQSLQAYDAVRALLAGLDRARQTGQKPGREAVLRALTSEPFSGVGGVMSFDERGEQMAAAGQVFRVEAMQWPGRDAGD